MSATNTFENDLLKLIFLGTTIANIANNASASPATSFYISLHTASPGEAGDQSTAETSFGGYARLPVTRDGAGWTVTDNIASNTADQVFAQNTAGTPTITHVGLGLASTGAGKLLFYDPLDTSLVMQVGQTPIFEPDALRFTAD